jgi:hypothetical protein
MLIADKKSLFDGFRLSRRVWDHQWIMFTQLANRLNLRFLNICSAISEILPSSSLSEDGGPGLETSGVTRTEDGGLFSKGEIGVASMPSGLRVEGGAYDLAKRYDQIAQRRIEDYGSRVKTRQSLTPHPSPLTPHSSPALFLFTIHHSHFALLASCSSLPSVCRFSLPFLLPSRSDRTKRSYFFSASRCHFYCPFWLPLLVAVWQSTFSQWYTFQKLRDYELRGSGNNS